MLMQAFLTDCKLGILFVDLREERERERERKKKKERIKRKDVLQNFRAKTHICTYVFIMKVFFLRTEI